MTATSTRNSQIATIKIATKQLGMDDATYRNMLANVANGKTSSTELSWAERKAVIDHLVAKGAVIKRSPKRKGAPNTLDRNASYQKIEALLASMGLPWSYADAIAENITGGKSGGIPRLGWVKDGKHLTAIIAALTYEQEKRCLLAQVDELLQAAGRTRADVQAKISPNYKKDWTRDKRALTWAINSIPVWWPAQQ